MWEFTELNVGEMILIIEPRCLFSLKQFLNSVHVFFDILMFFFIVNAWQRSINN